MMPFAVHILDGTGNLNGVEADLGLCQTFSSLHHVHEGTIIAKLEHEVCAIVEGEGPQELDNILVPHL